LENRFSHGGPAHHAISAIACGRFDRRKFVERDPGCHEGKSPDARYQDGDTDVGRFHLSLPALFF